ncbi:expressed unknown protein [Seminavis robusta]|uniref:Uncharacterized protein n=1 Tax=Seminavis robusta TaxID=568900 RepID=A0A9N8EBK9_9STRA|nr:expressed unknown protein [Seminavis robusta]|eukprot:Sro886_g216170.1 n/a (139) ;mRNA; f:7521-7937
MGEDIKKLQRKMGDGSNHGNANNTLGRRLGPTDDLWTEEKAVTLASVAAATAASASALASIAAALILQANGQAERDPEELANLLSQAALAASATTSSASTMAALISQENKGAPDDLTEMTDTEDDGSKSYSLDALVAN